LSANHSSMDQGLVKMCSFILLYYQDLEKIAEA